MIGAMQTSIHEARPSSNAPDDVRNAARFGPKRDAMEIHLIVFTQAKP